MRVRPLLSALFVAVLAVAAAAQPATRPAAAPPLYSNHPELLPSLGEHRPRLAEVWYPHILAAGLHGVAPGAEMVILDHEEFAPGQSEQYAKIISATRAATGLPVGIYGYGSRTYGLHAWHHLAEWLVAHPEEGDAPKTTSWRTNNLANKAADLDAAKANVEQQRPAAAAADILAPALYAHYVQPPEVAYKVAAAQLADAKAEAAAAEAWARGSIKYYQPRGPRRVVGFYSPYVAGVSTRGLLPREQRRAILQAYVDSGVSPIMWESVGYNKPERAEGVAAMQEDALAYYRMLDARADAN